MAAALPAHLRQHGPGDGEHAEDVGVEVSLRFGDAGLLHRAEHAVAGVVHQHVDPAEAGHALAHGLDGVRFAGYIDLDRQQARLVANGIDDGLGVARRGDDAVAARQRVADKQRAEAARCTGDEPDLALGLFRIGHD
ncbi:hypothetical protein D3C86_1498750 [compost metagenome]